MSLEARNLCDAVGCLNEALRAYKDVAPRDPDSKHVGSLLAYELFPLLDALGDPVDIDAQVCEQSDGVGELIEGIHVSTARALRACGVIKAGQYKVSREAGHAAMSNGSLFVDVEETLHTKLKGLVQSLRLKLLESRLKSFAVVQDYLRECVRNRGMGSPQRLDQPDVVPAGGPSAVIPKYVPSSDPCIHSVVHTPLLFQSNGDQPAVDTTSQDGVAAKAFVEMSDEGDFIVSVEVRSTSRWQLLREIRADIVPVSDTVTMADVKTSSGVASPLGKTGRMVTFQNVAPGEVRNLLIQGHCPANTGRTGVVIACPFSDWSRSPTRQSRFMQSLRRMLNVSSSQASLEESIAVSATRVKVLVVFDPSTPVMALRQQLVEASLPQLRTLTELVESVAAEARPERPDINVNIQFQYDADEPEDIDVKNAAPPYAPKYGETPNKSKTIGFGLGATYSSAVRLAVPVCDWTQAVNHTVRSDLVRFNVASSLDVRAHTSVDTFLPILEKMLGDARYRRPFGSVREAFWVKELLYLLRHHTSTKEELIYRWQEVKRQKTAHTMFSVGRGGLTPTAPLRESEAYTTAVFLSDSIAALREECQIGSEALIRWMRDGLFAEQDLTRAAYERAYAESAERLAAVMLTHRRRVESLLHTSPVVLRRRSRMQTMASTTDDRLGRMGTTAPPPSESTKAVVLRKAQAAKQRGDAQRSRSADVARRRQELEELREARVGRQNAIVAEKQVSACRTRSVSPRRALSPLPRVLSNLTRSNTQVDRPVSPIPFRRSPSAISFTSSAASINGVNLTRQQQRLQRTTVASYGPQSQPVPVKTKVERLASKVNELQAQLAYSCPRCLDR